MVVAGAVFANMRWPLVCCVCVVAQCSYKLYMVLYANEEGVLTV